MEGKVVMLVMKNDVRGGSQRRTRSKHILHMYKILKQKKKIEKGCQSADGTRIIKKPRVRKTFLLN